MTSSAVVICTETIFSIQESRCHFNPGITKMQHCFCSALTMLLMKLSLGLLSLSVCDRYVSHPHYSSVELLWLPLQLLHSSPHALPCTNPHVPFSVLIICCSVSQSFSKFPSPKFTVLCKGFRHLWKMQWCFQNNAMNFFYLWINFTQNVGNRKKTKSNQDVYLCNHSLL